MRCASYAGLAVLGLLLPGLALGQPLPDPALRAAARALQEQALTAPRPAWLGPEPGAGPGVEPCAELGVGCPAGPAPIPPAGAAAAPGIRLFLSHALGPAQLREAFALAAAQPGVQVVFRGVRPGERLTDFLAAVHALLADLEPPPEVVLDPTPFARHGIEAVPALVASDAAGERARVLGLVDPAWLAARLAAGEGGDLGTRGPVRAILEPDLRAEIERRLAAVDWRAARARGRARYWQQVGFEELPAATAERVRTLAARVVAAADLRAPDGRVLVAAGTAVEPLALLPFRPRLVVFDARVPAQVATARRLAAASPARVIHLATALDRAAGWAGLAALEDTLDAPVYLLTPELRTRFALERVPALVYARADRFVVHELPAGPAAGAEPAP